MTVQVVCRNCGDEFACADNRRRVYCKPECYEAFYHRYNKLRYRNDPAYREAMKTNNLQRYHRRKSA